MPKHEVKLSKLEKTWILERRVTRLSDNKEVQIYPMGAERYLSSVLKGSVKCNYDIKVAIQNKNILVIPGYGNSSFLFGQAGAQSITVYDKDPVTIAWMKAFKKYYHYKEQSGSRCYASIGELMTALTSWYPPRLDLPLGQLRKNLFWALQPNLLRRMYIHYMVSLVCQAIERNAKGGFELNQNIQFYAGTLDDVLVKHNAFDTVFVPYLLGVRNGIETKDEIISFINQLMTLVPNGHILINPSQNSRDFYIMGKRYFETTNYPSIQSIPELSPYVIKEDKGWFRTQGLAVLSSSHKKML